MRPSVYFLVCSSVRALLFVCLPSVLQPLGWEPLDFPRGQREASDPYRHGSVHFPHRGPGRGRADDERAADHAVRPQRACSPAIRRRRAAVDEGGGVSGGVLVYTPHGTGFPLLSFYTIIFLQL